MYFNGLSVYKVLMGSVCIIDRVVKVNADLLFSHICTNQLVPLLCTLNLLSIVLVTIA